MNDLISQALFAVNLPFTIVLAGLLGYWLLVSFGIFDLEGGDASADAVPLVDADAEADVDDVPGPWGALLSFLNIGEVPLMIVLTVLTLGMWVLGILTNDFFNDGSVLLGLVYLVPNFIVSAIVTRFATTPFKKIFRLLNREGPEHASLIGRTCLIKSSGQAEVVTDGAPILLQIRTREETLCVGDTALIISRDAETGACTVVKVTNEKLES